MTNNNKRIGRPRQGDILDSTMTDSKIMKYRLQGLSMRRIAERVNLSPTAVSNRINRILDEISLETHQQAEQYRTMEVERCNLAAVEIYKGVKTGDPKMIKLWHDNIKLRSELLQLFRPKTVLAIQINYDNLTDEQLEQLAKGVPLDQLAAGDIIEGEVVND